MSLWECAGAYEDGRSGDELISSVSDIATDDLNRIGLNMRKE